MVQPESDKPAPSFRQSIIDQQANLQQDIGSDSDYYELNNTNKDNHSSRSSSNHAVTEIQPNQLSQYDNALVIGIVAGEISGDALGADFMRQMNNLRDDIVWVGVGGAKMQAQGLRSLFELERLAVMGLVEVLAHLPDLLKARAELIEVFTKANIDWFIGVDAPDFNLRVSKLLKPKGVFCVQYVSPSIWAWRESRIHAIKKATHLVLCLFPFELPVYARYHHPAVCVGHPLLHTTPKSLLQAPIEIQRREIVWKNEPLQAFFSARHHNISQIICMLPGSRRGEIKTMLPPMLDAIQRLLLVDSDLCFIIPTLDENHRQIIQNQIRQFSAKHDSEDLKNAIAVVYDDTLTTPHFSQSIMTISDIIVLASGTATLEAMLVNRPMVVIYKLNKLTYHIASRLIKVPYVALPNILAGKFIVPELIQDDATGENISREVHRLMSQRAYKQQKVNLAKTTEYLYKQSVQSPAMAVVDAWIDIVNPL